jgi:hypothetical protein
VHRLLADPVAGIADPARRRLAALIAQVIGQLGIHSPLDQPFRQPVEQPVRAGDLLRRLRAGQELVDQLVRKLWRLGLDPHPGNRPLRELVWQGGLPSGRPAGRGSLKEPRPTTRLRSGPAYTENRTHPFVTLGEDLDFNQSDSVFDLDRSNGIPDLVSTGVIVAAAVGAMVLAGHLRVVRLSAVALAVALLVI